MAPRKLPSLRKPEPEAPAEEPVELPQAPPSLAPRFNLKLLLVMMFVFAVTCAAYGGMRRGVGREFYVIFGAAVPVLVLLVAGIAHQWTRRR